MYHRTWRVQQITKPQGMLKVQESRTNGSMSTRSIYYSKRGERVERHRCCAIWGYWASNEATSKQRSAINLSCFNLTDLCDPKLHSKPHSKPQNLVTVKRVEEILEQKITWIRPEESVITRCGHQIVWVFEEGQDSSRQKPKVHSQLSKTILSYLILIVNF